MFKNRENINKLLFPIITLALIFLILTVSLVSFKYSKSQSLSKLEKGIILATKLSKLLHETQIERGMTAGFISSNGKKFNKQLEIQRENTDQRMMELNRFIKKSNILNISKEIRKNLNQAFIHIRKLKLIREQIANLSINTKDAITYYIELNNIYLETIVEVSKISELPNITQNIVAYSNFLYSSENAGIERALGTTILTNNKLKQNKINEFNSLIVKQKLYNDIFLKYASDKFKAYYKKHFIGDSIKKVNQMRKEILCYKESEIEKIEINDWFYNITEKINKLKDIDDYLSDEVILSIKKELNKTQNELIVFVILNIASIVIFTIMIMLILNLVKSKARLSKIIDKYIISSSTDLKGVITDVSQAFCDISGYTKKELIGKPHNIIRDPDMPASAFKDMWLTIKAGDVWKGQVKNCKKDKGYYWVDANIEPLFNRNGDIESYMAIRIDITSKVDLEGEIEKNKQQNNLMMHQSRLAQMGEMISMIAHQWRQPLSAISSTSGAINLKSQLGILDSETTIKLSNKISEYSEHLSKTIDDFREFFKSNKEKHNTSYNELVESVLAIVETSLTTKNIKLITNLNCDKNLYTYPNEIKQVILNLIKNSEDVLLDKLKSLEISKDENKEFTPTIIIESNNGILTISDNGDGVREDIIDKVFDPYFSTKTKKDGTGLGLYMSKTIIEEHCGGQLTVYNNEMTDANGIVSNGAVFTIIIGNNNG